MLHLVQTDELAMARLDGRLAAASENAGWSQAGDVDAAADMAVEQSRGGTTAALLERWWGGAEALDAAFGAADPHERVTWVAGQLSVHTLATTRLAETWIHAGD